MNESRGEVYDLGYQHYDGPREGRWLARRAIFWNGVRTVLGLGRGPKAKIMPLLLFAAAIIPALVMTLIVSIAEPLAEALPGPATYYEVIAFLLFLAGAVMAPELVTPDRKDRVIDLYFVRPISRNDYLVGRFAAFFVIVLVLAFSGQIMLQIGYILAASDPLDYLQDNWLDIPRFLGAGVLIALFITIVPMAVASFTTRRAYASVFVIGLFFISSIMAEALTSAECSRPSEEQSGAFDSGGCEPVTGDAAKWLSLISLSDVPARMNDLVFDTESGDPSMVAARDLNDSIRIGVYALLTLGPAMLLWWQYRRISV